MTTLLLVIAALIVGAYVGVWLGTQWERGQQMAMDTLMSLPDPRIAFAEAESLRIVAELERGNDEKPTLH